MVEELLIYQLPQLEKEAMMAKVANFGDLSHFSGVVPEAPCGKLSSGSLQLRHAFVFASRTVV